MRSKSHKLEGLLLIILFAAMVAFSMKVMLGMISLFEEFDVPTMVNRGAHLFYIILILILCFYHRFDKSLLSSGVTQFLIIFLVLNIFSGFIENTKASELTYGNLSLTLAVVTYFVGYNLYLNYPKDGKLLQYLTIVSTLALCAEYFVISNTMRFDYNHTALNLGIAYLPLFLTPLLLLNNNKISWLCFVVIAYIIVDSGKRGGLVALLLSLVIYYASISRFVSKKNKILLISFGLIVTLISAFFFSDFFLTSEYVDRLLHGSEDSDYSSGRFLIYSDVISKYFDSDFIHWFLGHGLGSVAKYSKFDTTAHNDFIEAIFDFGIIGFISYVYFYVTFLLQTLKIPNKEIKLKGVFVYTLSLAFFISSFSHIFIYQYLCLFTFTWGAISGTRRQESNSQSVLPQNGIRKIESKSRL